MEFLLRVLVFVVVLALVFGTAAAVFLWWMARKIQKGMPQRITLVDAPDFFAKRPGVFEALAAEFAAMGFVPAGVYRVEEVPQMGIAAFANPERQMFGALSSFMATKPSVDVVREFAEGRVHTVTTVPPTGRPLPPFKGVVRIPAANVRELVLALENLPHEGTPLPHTAERFKGAFESSYAREMDWRTEQEAGMSAPPADDEPDPADLDARLREAFLANTTFSPEDQEAIREEGVFVHDGLSDLELSELLAEAVEDEMDVYRASNAMQGANAREKFRDLLRRLELTHRYPQIGTMAEPVACDVYRAQ